MAVCYVPLRSFMFLQGGACPVNCIRIIYVSIREKKQKVHGFEIFAKACPSEIRSLGIVKRKKNLRRNTQ